MAGPVQPEGDSPWPQKAALKVCFQQRGRCWSVALFKGTFSQVLLQKSVFPLHATCDVCVLSSSPLQDKGLLSSRRWSAARQQGRGTLPCPSLPFRGTPVRAAVLCIYLWRVRCCLNRKETKLQKRKLASEVLQRAVKQCE